MPEQTHKTVQARPDLGRAILMRANGTPRLSIPLLLSVAAAGLVAAATILAPCDASFPGAIKHGSARGFHVVVVTLGSTRADRIGGYGYENARTPALDALAAGGIRFADAVSSAPLTLPSHATMFTGLDPTRHGVRNDGEFRLAPSAMTLAEVLQANGYDTAAFVSSFDLDARFGLNQGFDHYDDAMVPLPSRPSGSPGERSAEVVTDAALTWLQHRDSGDRPFFLWVHYSGLFPSRDHARGPQGARPRDPYDSKITRMDEQVGRLFDGLVGGGVWDDTLVIVAGDHGEGLGEHGESDHSQLLYESTQQVPMLLACPGLVDRSYVVDDVVVGSIDIYPTVLDLLGIARSQPCDGMSLVQAATHDDRVIYMETLASYLDNGWSPLYALRRHKDKYIFAPEREYYSLGLDPQERINLYQDMSPRTLAKRTELESRMASYLRNAAPLNQAVALRQIPNDAIRARLDALAWIPGTVVESYIDALDPKYLVGTYNHAEKASALAESGNLAGAMTEAKLGLAISPNDRKCLEQIGAIHLLEDRPNQADAMFRRAIEIRSSANLYVALAQVLVAQDRLDEARELLDRAKTLEPENGGIFITRGDIYHIQGFPGAGFEAFQQAKRVDPYRFAEIAENRLTRLSTAYGECGRCPRSSSRGAPALDGE